MKKGIDVSYAQGNINWGHVTTDFAIIRAGYGRETSQKDAQFENNYTGCKSNGIPCGVYWYSYAEDEEDAKREAKACLEVIKGKTFEYPIYFDIEDSIHARMSKEKFTNTCKAFCNELEKAGYWAGIYSFANMLTNKLTDKNRYAVWVAHTDVAKPNYDGQYGMWQYSHRRQINGVQGNVDMNYCYFDYPAAIKKKGLNGFKKSTTNKTKTYVVKKGDTLWDIAKKFGTTVDKLAKNNKIDNPDVIYAGQKLII